MNIRKIIREEINDWEWLEDVPAQNPTELRNYKLIFQAFEGSEFNVELGVVLHHNYAFINDKNGDNYTVLRLNGDSWDWRQQLIRDIRQAVNICGEDCELTQKSKEIYRIFNDRFFPDRNNVNESEGDDLDWIRDVSPIDLDREVKRFVDKGYVVALWFGHINDDFRQHIHKFIIKEGFNWTSNRAKTAWIYGNLVKGLTFYPNMEMGGFHGVNARDSWEFYNEQAKNGGYEDVNPSRFRSVDFDRP